MDSIKFRRVCSSAGLPANARLERPRYNFCGCHFLSWRNGTFAFAFQMASSRPAILSYGHHLIRLQTMQRNLWRTIEPYRNDGRACSDRPIPSHLTILPWTRAHIAWQNRIKGNRDASRTEDLATSCDPVLNVKIIYALPKYLGLVIGFNSKT
jgi:hypothetical protein